MFTWSEAHLAKVMTKIMTNVRHEPSRVKLKRTTFALVDGAGDEVRTSQASRSQGVQDRSRWI